MGFWITASVDRTALQQAQGGAPSNDPYDESIVATILLLLYFVTIAVLILMLLATFRSLFTTTAGLTRKLSRRMSGRKPAVNNSAEEDAEKIPVSLDDLQVALELGRCDDSYSSNDTDKDKKPMTMTNKKKAHRRPEQHAAPETTNPPAPSTMAPSQPPPPPLPRVQSPAQFARAQMNTTVEERRREEMSSVGPSPIEFNLATELAVVRIGDV
jgi:hypothetical protein